MILTGRCFLAALLGCPIFSAAIGVGTVFYEDPDGETPSSSEESASGYPVESQPDRRRSYSPAGPSHGFHSPPVDREGRHSIAGAMSSRVAAGASASPWMGAPQPPRSALKELKPPTTGRNRRESDVSAVSFSLPSPHSPCSTRASPFFPGVPSYD